MLELNTIEKKILDGERLATGEALALLEDAPLSVLGPLADHVRRRKHPEGVVTYIIDRNINYTNVCNAFCDFCAFYAAPNDTSGKAYVIGHDELDAKIQETFDLGGRQILLQGGHNPKLKIDYYEDLAGSGFRVSNPNATGTCGCGHSFSA